MRLRKLGLTCLAVLSILGATSCADDDDEPNGNAGSGGASGGSAGSGGAAGGTSNGGSEPVGASGGLPQGGEGGSTGEGGAPVGGGSSEAGSGHGGDGNVPQECGDPDQDGVLIDGDITSSTTWSCPVYTLTKPIYVHSSSDTPVVLTIDPGVRVRGVEGVEGAKLPGALVITRSARIDAIGTPTDPIVFTRAKEPAPNETTRYNWGGVMLLGGAPVSAPAPAGKVAGELNVEGLPPSALSLYGRPRYEAEAGSGGAGGAGGEGNVGPTLIEQDPTWTCGRMQYVRIEFPGFAAGAGKEINGLTLAGCGSETLIDHVQVHRSSDDGIELFGGTVNLTNVVLTGNQDDSLDWDQGWQGKAQFVAIQSADDDDPGDSCGIEANGYPKGVATLPPEAGEPSEPRIFNLTLILSKTTLRGIRFRDNSRAFLGNAILAAHSTGVPAGLIHVEHVQTADNLASGTLAVNHSIFRGSWPAAAVLDSQGNEYVAEDYFTGNGAGALGNTEIGAASELWLDAFNEAAPQWVPGASSPAASGAMTPTDVDGSSFFDDMATYRGAFEPGGEDWTAGWTSYP